jgi:hypothetical protein
MSNVKLRAAGTAVSLEQLLTDLQGLERLQSLQMSLIRALRQEVERSCARTGRRRHQPKRTPRRTRTTRP